MPQRAVRAMRVRLAQTATAMMDDSVSVGGEDGAEVGAVDAWAVVVENGIADGGTVEGAGVEEGEVGLDVEAVGGGRFQVTGSAFSFFWMLKGVLLKAEMGSAAEPCWMRKKDELKGWP